QYPSVAAAEISWAQDARARDQGRRRHAWRERAFRDTRARWWTGDIAGRDAARAGRHARLARDAPLAARTSSPVGDRRPARAAARDARRRRHAFRRRTAVRAAPARRIDARGVNAPFSRMR